MKFVAPAGNSAEFAVRVALRYLQSSFLESTPGHGAVWCFDGESTAMPQSRCSRSSSSERQRAQPSTSGHSDLRVTGFATSCLERRDLSPCPLSYTIFPSGVFAHACERLDGSAYEYFQFLEQGPGRKPWIRAHDAGTILAGGSPRSGAQRSIHFRADQDHWLSLVRDAVARGVISMTEHDGMRSSASRLTALVRSKWLIVEIPHHPREDDTLPTEAGHSPPAPIPDREDNERQPDALDPREHTTLLVLVAAAARAGKLDAASIERATNELGVTLSRRTINKHLASIEDAIERRKNISH